MDKYHDFKVEDFAEDPYFYAWVTSPDPESDKFWNEWIEQNPGKYAIITEARTLLGTIGSIEEEVSTQRVENLWNKIDQGIDALDKYQQYTAEDFADDPHFFAWVTEPDEMSKAFWHTWLEINPEKHAMIKEAKSLISMLQLKEDDIPQSKIDNLWNRIDSRIDNLWNEIESGMEAIDQYYDFKAEDFANDPSFFAWINDSDPQTDDFWQKWLEQNPEKTSIIEEAKRLVGMIQVKEEDDIPQSKIDNLWNRIDSRIDNLWNSIESGMEAIDQYYDFSAEDFANDPSFFLWVTEANGESNDFWQKWLEQNSEKTNIIEEAKRLVGMIQVKEEDDIPQSKIDDLWNRIDDRIGNLWGDIESGMEAIDQYKDFTAEDFADDPSFFLWVTEPDEQLNAHWNTWLEQNPEKVSTIDDARLIILNINLKAEVPQARIDNLWSQISQGIEKAESKGNSTATRSISLKRFYAVAASVVVLLGAFFIWRNMATGNSTPTIASTLKGEQKTINLPDGSTATLNADSRVSYQSNTWNKNRSLQLNGEAFFDVKKGSKFEVNTTHGKVEVLGTTFNVFVRQQTLKVECLSGKVRLSEPKGKAIKVLTPGMGAKIKDGKLNSYAFEKTNTSQWHKGEFNYEATPLSQVFDEVARQYNIKFVFKIDIKAKDYDSFNGFFSNKDDLSTTLKSICSPVRLKYTIQNDSTKTVVIQK